MTTEVRSVHDGEEVRELLGGAAAGVSDDELPAIAFAQHFAERRGIPTCSRGRRSSTTTAGTEPSGSWERSGW